MGSEPAWGEGADQLYQGGVVGSRGAFEEQVGGVGVAEAMRVRQQAAKDARVEPSASHGDEQRVARAAREGRAPYSTVRAKPGKWRLNQPVIVPWQTPPQSRLVVGRLRWSATCRANLGRLTLMSTPLSGWWKLRM